MLFSLLQLWRALHLVLFPRRCAGCGVFDEILCPLCQREFCSFMKRRIVQSFTVYSCAPYSEPVRSSILSWKDHGDEELDALFSAFLERRCVSVLNMAASERYNTSTDTPRSLCIVPVPSSPQSVKKRGRLHMLPLARHLVERLNVRFLHDEFPLSAHVCTCLSMDKHVHKSVTRSTKKSRSQRLNKGLLITASHELNHSQVILIDDIITTGSTVRACVRILRAQGAHIVAVCALADADKSNTEHADIEGNTDA